MNKTAIKNFAIWARNKLIADIRYRAGLLGITPDGVQDALPQSTGQTEFYDIGTAEPYSITGDAIRQRRHLVERIRAKEKETDYQTACKYVIEEVAYTWFNRLIAVRFMEVNDYLPGHIRVLSSDTGKLEPDLVTTPFDAELEFTDAGQQTIIDLKNDNKLDEAFRLLFIKQCNALHAILPSLFEKTSDYTELLLNLSVIDQDGVVYHLVHDIPEEDFDVERGGQVEIIGWLYQYYNTEPKNEAFAKKGKITKEEIPAVTQLFTPDWIVRYMIENSVGRLWIEHLRALDESTDEAALAADFGWKYYLPEAKQEPDVEEKLRELRKERASLTPEQITLIDPCVGSGHILVYGFSVLMQIYENAGYGRRDAAKRILEHNLFGLDIDDRAYQMAYFAVMMKAREYDRRLLSRKDDDGNPILPQSHIFSIRESNGISDAALGDLGSNLSDEERAVALEEIRELIAEFKDAKEYGSILNIEKRDWDLLRRFAVPNVSEGQLSLDMNGAEAAAGRLQEIIDIAEVLSNKYLSVVTNPPYCGTKDVNERLSQYVKKNYPLSKADLSTVFMEKGGSILANFGFMAMINIPIWLNKSTMEKLRVRLLNDLTIINMLDFDRGVFGSDFGTVSFVFAKHHCPTYAATYLPLYRERGKTDPVERKKDFFFQPKEKYTTPQVAFDKIPSHKIAYTYSLNMVNVLANNEPVSKYADVKSGLQTGNNDLFLRLWQEVGFDAIGRNISSRDDIRYKNYRWFPHTKGGSFRKWYGNFDYIVDWENDGYRVKNYEGTGIAKNQEYYFEPCLSWSHTSMRGFSARYVPGGFMFNVEAPSAFRSHNPYELLGFLNSNFTDYYFKASGSSLHYLAGAIDEMPCIMIPSDRMRSLVQECISVSREDWNSFENSWEFSTHPLIGASKISDAFKVWSDTCDTRFSIIKRNEEDINEILLSACDLTNEINTVVDETNVTIHKADLQRDIKSLLSYAVGCMFGRYSLDIEGLAYAGGDWDVSKYSTFLPDADNVIPITDEEYLEDDIVSLLCTWLKVVYGESTLEENLDFIAKALGKKGNSSREIIRNYFLNDFFKDHCQTYSVTGSGKRPIYWLFDGGKQNGFKALIYLHRYTPDDIGNLRIDYLHRMQRIYESEIERMQDMIDHSTNAREVGQATKRRDKLTKQLKECREYDEKLAHLALSRIELDLDDGVKVNYRKVQTAKDGKFYEVLADSKKIMANDKLWAQHFEWKKE